MGDGSKEAVSRILGDPGAADAVDRLLPLIYDDLRDMARRELSGRGRGQTLCTTSLVHEAYFKLAGSQSVSKRGRTYFFGAAARAMRQILVDHARRRGRQKRGGDQLRITLATNVGASTFAEDLVDLDDALGKLAAVAPRQARVVECRYFGGMTVDETAELLEVSERTIRNDWELARAWLHRALHEPPGRSDGS